MRTSIYLLLYTSNEILEKTIKVKFFFRTLKLIKCMQQNEEHLFKTNSRVCSFLSWPILILLSPILWWSWKLAALQLLGGQIVQKHLKNPLPDYCYTVICLAVSWKSHIYRVLLLFGPGKEGKSYFQICYIIQTIQF